MGGLGIPIFKELSVVEYENSLEITTPLQKEIISQNRGCMADDNQIRTAKAKVKQRKAKNNLKILNKIIESQSNERTKQIEINLEKGASVWLTTLPLKDEGFQLDKQSFWDLMKIRYGRQLSRLPERCACSAPFNLQHALSCKKGGFVSNRHNTIRDTTACLLRQVCRDVKVEPNLLPLTGETLQERTANRTEEARLDIAARGFWVPGQKAFFDVRVFNPFAGRYRNSKASKAYEINEREKKRAYNERVLQVEQGSFTPLVFNAMGGMGRESHAFYKKLAELLAEKRNQPLHTITAWIHRKISFSLIKAIIICVRGSRKTWSEDPTIT
jgi:hypothetical protein